MPRRRSLAGSLNRETFAAPPERVFDLLADPSTYPEWLVGSQAIRSVDDTWPRVGARFHHRIGFGPLRIPGSSTIRDYEAPHLLTISAGLGPLGEAVVRMTVDPAPGGSTVTVEEEPRRGPLAVLWRVGSPAVLAALWGRNSASLDALRDLVERADRPTSR